MLAITIVLSPNSVPSEVGRIVNDVLVALLQVVTPMLLKLWVRAKNLCPVALLVICTSG